jgi:hypothetical protein
MAKRDPLSVEAIREFVRDDIHKFSEDMVIIETSDHILRLVKLAKDWSDVEDILQAHREFYLALSPLVRGHLNNTIRMVMSSRRGGAR